MRVKTPEQITIIHLSDLHFGSQSSLQIAALLADLKKFKDQADLVFCTGDLTDNPLLAAVKKKTHLAAMKAVRAFLESICREYRINPATNLFVVPGNHDYRVQGLFWRKSGKRFFNKKRCFRYYFRNELRPNLGLVIYSFDSNSSDGYLNFASGAIDPEDLVSFANQMQDWESQCADFHALTKIVLLHHHPMPIAETESRAVTDREEFLLLQNARTFMKEMAKAKIDLILHGHKHFIGYSRAKFPIAEDVQEIAVVAAGSAGQSYNGIFSYNVLRVRAEQPIEVEQRIFNKGTYEKSISFAVPGNYEEWRQARFQKWLREKSHDIVADTCHVDITIERTGDAKRHTLMKSMKAVEHEVTHRETSFISAVAKFEEPQSSCLNRHEQKVDYRAVTKPDGTVHYDMVFEPSLRKNQPLDVEIRRNINNAFFFYQQDRLDVTGNQKKTESVGWSEIGLFTSLRLTVRFLHDYAVMTPRAEVEDDSGKKDPGESDYAATGFVYSPRARIAQLTVRHPVPGNIYRIVWDLPQEDEPTLPAKERLNASAIEESLLNCSSNKEQNHGVRNSLQELWEILRDEFLLAGNDDKLEIAIMGFHSQKRVLQVVVGLYPDNHPIFQWELKKGQGIEGQALRRKSNLFAFQADSVSDSEWKKYHINPPHLRGTLEAYSLVFAVPLSYPLNSSKIIGLLRIASASKRSNLLDLESHMGVQERFAKIVIEEGYVKRFLPAFGFAGPHAYLDNESRKIQYLSVDREGRIVQSKEA